MITRNTVKAITKLIVVFGTCKITSEVIAHNVDAPQTFSDKLQIKAGSLAIGGVVAGATAKYSDATVDEIAIGIDKIRAALSK